MGSFYKQQLNDWVASLDVKAGVVLDIGGSQNPIKGRTKTWDVKQYYIYDLADPHVELQKSDVAFDLDRELVEPKHEADLLFCLEVFDYVRQPSIAFANLSMLLKKGGQAWVSFPFVYPHHNPIDAEGFRYTEPVIRYLTERVGLKTEEIIYRRPRPSNRKLLEFYAEDGMRAAPDWDHNVTGYIVRFSK